MAGVDKTATGQEHLARQIESTKAELDKQLEKKTFNGQQMFEIVCKIQMYLARQMGIDVRQDTRELTKALEKSIEDQRGTYATYHVTAIKSAGLIAGVATDFKTGASIGQMFGIPGQTADERMQSFRLTYDHAGKEATRLRDERTSARNRSDQSVQEAMESMKRAAEAESRAKTSIFNM